MLSAFLELGFAFLAWGTVTAGAVSPSDDGTSGKLVLGVAVTALASNSSCGGGGGGCGTHISALREVRRWSTLPWDLGEHGLRWSVSLRFM